MAGIVKSVEYIELTFSNIGDSSLQTVQQDLSLGQAHANTVVWEARAYDNGTDGLDTFVNRLFDAWVDDNAGTARLNAERDTNSTSGAAILRCFIVEFDSTAVTVQKGTWTIGAATTATAAISAVTETASFIKFFCSAAGVGTDDYEDFTFHAVFSSTTEITFTKMSSNGGTISGHWQVIEADGGEFTVEHASATASSNAETFSTAITAVVLADTFIAYSYATNESADDSRDGVWSSQLSSTVGVTGQSANGVSANHGGTEQFRIAVVEAQNSEFSVQRLDVITQTTAGDESESITAVADVDFTTVHLNLAAVHSTGESSSTTPDSDNWTMQLAAKLASSSTIEVFSGVTTSKRYSVEIIEWVEVAVAAGFPDEFLVKLFDPTQLRM